jgi:hypothetical protein
MRVTSKNQLYDAHHPTIFGRREGEKRRGQKVLRARRAKQARKQDSRILIATPASGQDTLNATARAEARSLCSRLFKPPPSKQQEDNILMKKKNLVA